MTVVSFYYLFFLAIGVLIYYAVPKKVQWIILLLLSLIFYVSAATPYTIVFLIASTIIAYTSTIYIYRHKDAEIYAKTVSIVAIVSVLINILMWFLLKGSAFWILGSILINKVIPGVPVLRALPVVSALGMGYYTAQIIGYILDVLWGNADAQKNPIKLFLFLCFFPQLTVGPVSRYNDLLVLYDYHKFSYQNICIGAQRILWGFFKKLVISDRVAIIVNSIWNDTTTYGGVWPWIAVFLYPLEIYTDFSGCMDVVLGTSELFDIHLSENFRNPFFSRNSQEFWQRWHITLGSWARDYVYYPVMKSRWMVNFGKKCKKKYGKRWGKFIPWSLSMAILWFVMGVWHGSVHHIFGVSLWFWLALVISELFEPITKKITCVLRIKTESFGWHFYQSGRTYAVYALGAVFFTSSSLQIALAHYRVLGSSLSQLNPWTLFDGTVLNLGVSWKDINLIIFGCVCLILADYLRERYDYARIWVRNQSFGFRWLIWIGIFLVVLIYGMYGPEYNSSTFIYQGF
ncbi:MBOAT family O-acyltransferase [Butyrivibrio sp. XPD2002]|uniref:MBOAT family O-acyltransferase n=1 Tax=Butyrivibrio sp. XPD2002 TaxID=1280665 RepID=UPI0004023EEB|nr:MBOAT family O-acyltransferase [Butyrivibrio sp. XPD2002]